MTTSKYDGLIEDPPTAVVADEPETTEAYVSRLEVAVNLYQTRLEAAEAAAHGLAETLRVMVPPSPALGWAYHVADDLAKQLYVWRRGAE